MNNSTYKSKKLLNTEIEDRRNLTIWKRPFSTIYYFILEVLYRLNGALHKITRNKIVACLFLLSGFIYYLLRSAPGPQNSAIIYFEKKTMWYFYWIVLGFLSSCGFGSGLHTFVLYLGPFIAQVTMSAYVCQSVDFPEPPYPDEIVCPSTNSSDSMSIYSIVRKVQAESIFWGLGTAIGELPPYFMARASRLSGRIQDEEIELTLNTSPSSSDADADPVVAESKQKDSKGLTYVQRAELLLNFLITRGGFLGILICASVPNPLFDLAGISCGHFLVPFSTFFGATAIGKAIIKTHIQMLFIIMIFSEDHINSVVYWLGNIPIVGKRLQKPFLEYLQQQKDKLINKVTTKTSWIQTAVQLIVIAAMAMFCISLVNAFAQTCHRRLCQEGKIDLSPAASAKKSAKNSSSRTEVCDEALKKEE